MDFMIIAVSMESDESLLRCRLSLHLSLSCVGSCQQRRTIVGLERVFMHMLMEPATVAVRHSAVRPDY